MFPDGTVLNWYEPSALLVEVLMFFSTQYSPAAKAYRQVTVPLCFEQTNWY
jgi:hypothetical protein